jgi:hypothetical protein
MYGVKCGEYVEVTNHITNSYGVTFIDDYSHYCFVLPIKTKSDVFEAFKTFKAYAENQSEHRIKTLRDDKGGESSLCINKIGHGVSSGDMEGLGLISRMESLLIFF